VCSLLERPNRPDLHDQVFLGPGRFDTMLYLCFRHSRQTIGHHGGSHQKVHHLYSPLSFPSTKQQYRFTLSPTLFLRSISETLPFTYTGADLYTHCSDAMVKAITRQANIVDEKVQRLSATSEEPLQQHTPLTTLLRPKTFSS